MIDKQNALVLYFSQMGHVQKMAQVIANTLSIPQVQIMPEQTYPEVYNELADMAKAERDQNKRPLIANLQEIKSAVAAYQVIFLGYPIWWYQLPMILDTLFDNVDFTGKTIIQFNTHEGSGEGGSTQMIAERAPGATVRRGLSIQGEALDTDDQNEKIQRWLNDLA